MGSYYQLIQLDIEGLSLEYFSHLIIHKEIHGDKVFVPIDLRDFGNVYSNEKKQKFGYRTVTFL